MISRCNEIGAKYINQFLLEYKAIGYTDSSILFSCDLSKKWKGYSQQKRSSDICVEELYEILQDSLYIGTPFKEMKPEACRYIMSVVNYCIIDIRKNKGIINLISKDGLIIISDDYEEYTGDYFDKFIFDSKETRRKKIIELLESINMSNYDIFIKNVVE